LLNIGAAKVLLVGVYTISVSYLASITQAEMLTPDPWLQYGSLGVLAFYILLHWLERKDQRRRMEPVLRELNGTLEGLKVLVDERLPRRDSDNKE